MKLWDFFKRKFNHANNKEAAQKTITRLVNSAFALLQGENYVEARGVLLRALEHKNEIENPALLEWILTWLYVTWEKTEEHQESATFFSEFLARNPDYVLALQLRAESYWYGGALKEAIADYTRSLELKPNDAGALSGRGQVLMECREFGRALEDLNGALESSDRLEDADENSKIHLEAYTRNGRAATLAGLGDFAGALEEFEKSINLCPENAWVYFNRAEAYRNQGDRLNAAENYKLALTKKQPKLTSLKRAHAKRVLEELRL